MATPQLYISRHGGPEDDELADTPAQPQACTSSAAERRGSADDSDEEDPDEAAYVVHDLVEKGAISRLRSLLPAKSQSAGEQPTDRMCVMSMEACLLEKDDMGCLPLHVAFIHQRTRCAKHLLRYSDALTSAMLRIKCGDLNTPIVHLLLRVGAINAAFAEEILQELLGETTQEQHLYGEDVQALLLEKIQVRDEEGNTVFQLCAMYDLTACFELLVAFYKRQLEHHSSDQSEHSSKLPSVASLLERSNRLGYRPIHAAMKFHSVDMAHKLVTEYEVKLNETTMLNQTPMHIASLASFEAGVVFLLESERVDLSLVDNHGKTALQVAQGCKFSSIERIITSGPDANANAASEAKEQSPNTRFFFHPDSLRHMPMAYHRRGGNEPPPENLERIDTLVDPTIGILRSKEFQRDHLTWDYEIPRADIADVLRVHEYHYVDTIRRECASLASKVDSPGHEEGRGKQDPNDPEECNRVFTLDLDTALSLRSYEAATRAAGAVCKAVDEVIAGKCTNAFCVVRPPGHHAGPVGKVTCPNDPEGSHGFCLFNNVAIGAAYARSHYKRNGINKIAILDFDVHHGNGTEEIVRQLVPSTTEYSFSTPYGHGKQVVHQYKPWRNEEDPQNVFFCSVHGYGHKDPENHPLSSTDAAWFYPGSGDSSVKKSPFIWNVGLEFCREGASVSRLKWRSAFRDRILPELMEFKPDLIFLSAGFDAHKRESVNWGYVSLLEQDYEWLVHHVKQVAASCCDGRLISVLEGGYNFHGRMVSPFARSVAAHARALIHPSQELWSPEDIAKDAAHERLLLENYLSAHGHTPVHSMEAKKRHGSSGDAADAAGEPVAVVSMPMVRARSKRARKDVDYVALAAELAKQDHKEQ